MSTSFSLTSDQLVLAALRKLSVLSDGQDPSPSQIATGTVALNAMLKAFAAKGMPLWAITEQDIALTGSRSYTLSNGAPLKVTQALLVDTLSGTNIPMNVKSHYDYNLLANTNTLGTPVNYWYEPLNQTGVLHVWPTPDSYSIANCKVRIVYQRPVNDMVNGTDALDFPQHWIEAVIYGLTYRLSSEYGIPLQDRGMMAQEAQVFLQEALSFDTEEGSLFLMPDWTTRQ